MGEQFNLLEMKLDSYQWQVFSPVTEEKNTQIENHLSPLLCHLALQQNAPHTRPAPRPSALETGRAVWETHHYLGKICTVSQNCWKRN